MDENEFFFVGGQPVIHDNVHPLSKVPQMEVEDATVATTILPPLVPWNNLGGGWRERRAGGERGGGRGEREGGMEWRERRVGGERRRNGMEREREGGGREGGIERKIERERMGDGWR